MLFSVMESFSNNKEDYSIIVEGYSIIAEGCSRTPKAIYT